MSSQWQKCLKESLSVLQVEAAGAVMLQGWLLLRKFSILTVHMPNSQPCLQVFKTDLFVLNILLYYHDKKVSRAVYWHKTSRVFLPADGRVETCSAAGLPLQRNRGVEISGKVTIVGNSRGNSRPDSKQAANCQNALSILAMVIEELQNQEQDKSVWFKSYREWLKQVWEFCSLSL